MKCNKSLILSLAGIFLFVLSYHKVEGQQKWTDFSKMEITKDQHLSIKLRDETSYTGRFDSKTDSTLIIYAGNVKIELKYSEIESIKEVAASKYVNGKYWFPNPHHTRYLFGPSAFNLKKDAGYYQNIYGTINTINYGITDHFTMGAGTELISLFSGSPVFMITPKFGGYKLSDNWHAGGGAFLALIPDGYGGIGYGIITYGNEDSNLTFGTGWGFSDGSIASNPIFTVSAMHRVSRTVSLITENWVLPFDGYEPVFSYGVRFFGERMSVDIAFINSPEISEILKIGFPYVDFVYKF